MPNQYQFNGKEVQDELDLGWLDYGARMYDKELGRFNSIDKRSRNYMSYTPYGYTANNPINYVDYNGEFILPKEFLQRFKRIAQYLANGIQDVLKNEKIVSALKKHSGYSDEQLKEIFTWGRGPVLHPAKFAGEKFSEVGNTKALMTYDNKGSLVYQPGSAYITINIDLFEDLETATGKDRDYMLFMTAVTILHELVHYGFFENNLDTKTSEEGNDFEIEAYGQLVRISSGTYKTIMDNWLNQNKPSFGSGNTPFINRPDSKLSKDSDNKQREPDADKRAAKRSGGG